MNYNKQPVGKRLEEAVEHLEDEFDKQKHRISKFREDVSEAANGMGKSVKRIARDSSDIISDMMNKK